MRLGNILLPIMVTAAAAGDYMNTITQYSNGRCDSGGLWTGTNTVFGIDANTGCRGKDGTALREVS